MARTLPCAPLAAACLSLGLGMALGTAGSLAPALAGPLLRGGVGGPASGAGVLPGAGYGQAGPGLVNPAPAAVAPATGGVGGPASGAGYLPGAGFGQAGPGLVRPATVAPVAPAAGGVGGPASGAGVLPGAGVGRAGLGL